MFLLAAFLGFSLNLDAAPARRVLPQNLAVNPRFTNSLERLDPTNQLSLVIGLRLRDPKAVDEFLRAVYDPDSPNFHHYLTPKEFADKFGPTPADYASVIEFARLNGFAVKEQHPGRMILKVIAPVTAIEKAFQVKILKTKHPIDNGTFFLPDSAPSVPAELPILQIGGLDSLSRPKPLASAFIPLDGPIEPQAEWSGEGPYKTYIPKDFRAAYASDTALDGAGQRVALLEFDTCYASDIKAYEMVEGLTNTPIVHVRLPGASATPGPDNVEVAADIEMAIGMAPGLSSVMLYEGSRATNSYTSEYISILLRMAEDDAAAQLSSSWNPPADASLIQDQIFQQMAAQGQSFFQASGDQGAYAEGVFQRADNPYITVVGGSSLSIEIWGVSGPSGEYYFPVYNGETVWNGGVSNNVSGGGISSNYPIPFWQEGLDLADKGGSSTKRNSPDVAMVADGVYVRAQNGKWGALGGTSVAAPLWAGYTALVNQKAASNGLSHVGFLNPALYTIGKGRNYSVLLHDITAGNNATAASPNLFYAGTGYDLCTGWGSPSGGKLINALTTGRAQLSIDPTNEFIASGMSGGPFDTTNKAIILANDGWIPIDWALGNVPPWLDVSATAGTLAPNESTTVDFNLSGLAATLGEGIYSAAVVFTNISDGTENPVSFTLRVWQLGSLQVTISPEGAIPAGAQWRVDGGDWRESGTVATGLISSNHVIEYAPVANWTTPPDQTILIVGNRTNGIEGTYGTQFGSIQVSLFPRDPVVKSAHWRVDEGPWMNDGDIATGLIAGSHTLTFSDVPGWVTPPDGLVAIDGNRSTNLQPVYAEQYIFTTIAGAAGISGSKDGTNCDALFSSPNGITIDAETNLIVADTGNSVIRKIRHDGTNWVVTTIAGLANAVGTNDGCNEFARFDHPLGITADSSGNLIITDTGNEVIRMVTQGSNSVVTTIAGLPGSSGVADGAGTDARFTSPSGIAVDTNGTIYEADATYLGRACSISKSGTNWNVNTYTPVEFRYYPSSVTIPPGTRFPYISTYGDLSSITESFVWVNGWPRLTRSKINVASVPSNLQGLTTDAEGNIYGCGDHSILKMVPFGIAPSGLPSYSIATIGGVATAAGDSDGTNNFARFRTPAGTVVAGDGALYVSDTGNHTIRRGVSRLRRVHIQADPNDSVVQGASFQVDGGGWTQVGTAVRLVPGQHTITFGTIPDWNTPSNQVISVSETNENVFTGVYVHQSGSLRISLAPSDVVLAGAQWRLDNGEWQNSDSLLTGLTIGWHELSFAIVPGWLGPPDGLVWVDGGTNAWQQNYTFVDTNGPSVAIVSPQSGQTMYSNSFVLSGTATDNVAVASVWYNVNQTGWNQAVGTSQWRSSELILGAGPVVAQVYAIDTAGNASPTRTVSFRNAPSIILTLTTSGLGVISPNANGQLLSVGKLYSLTARPGANWIFEQWSGDIQSSTPSFSFVAKTNIFLKANFAPSPYPGMVGTYAGIFCDTNSVTLPSSGFFSANLSAKGTFSAKIQTEQGAYQFSGRFSPEGMSSNYIPRQFNPIKLQMAYDASEGGRITGALLAPEWKAHLVAYRSVYSKTNFCSLAGKYTLCCISEGDSLTLQPGGIGFGSATVGSDGNIKFVGTLGDGVAFSEGAFISKQGFWPFYVGLYSGTGAVLGWLEFSESKELQGSLVWIKRPQISPTGLYPAGFSLPVYVRGSTYSASNYSTFNFTSGQVILQNGNLDTPLTNAVSAVGKGGPGYASLSISTSTGVFHGIAQTTSGNAIEFNGALLQSELAGYGIFLGTNQTGKVLLRPSNTPP